VYRVIIVEDSDWIRKGLEFTVPWQDYGFTVVGTAANGRDGYDLAMRLEPDLALVDIKMPVMDGLAMMERLRDHSRRSPEFIVVSGYDDFSFARRAILLGARDYLLKPVSDEDLAGVLRRMSAALSRNESARRLEAVFEGQSFDPEFVAFFRRLLDESVRNDDLVGYAARRIEERFDTDIALGDVAAELEVSESTLGRRMKIVTGCTFVEYATMVRVRKALEMLADPACRVNEVAYKVGISDARYFSSLFKRYTGFTPSQFRKIVEGSPTDIARDESEGEPR
jgi:two-component system, response regulator YesN